MSLTTSTGVWSAQEHDRYLHAIRHNRGASWKSIAQLVGTRSARQVQTHHQKFVTRCKRLLENNESKFPTRREHAIDPEIVQDLSQRSTPRPPTEPSLGDTCQIPISLPLAGGILEIDVQSLYYLGEMLNLSIDDEPDAEANSDVPATASEVELIDLVADTPCDATLAEELAAILRQERLG